MSDIITLSFSKEEIELLVDSLRQILASSTIALKYLNDVGYSFPAGIATIVKNRELTENLLKRIKERAA